MASRCPPISQWKNNDVAIAIDIDINIDIAIAIDVDIDVDMAIAIAIAIVHETAMIGQGLINGWSIISR